MDCIRHFTFAVAETMNAFVSAVKRPDGWDFFSVCILLLVCSALYLGAMDTMLFVWTSAFVVELFFLGLSHILIVDL